VTQKIGDHYAACMDEARVDRLGASPLKADLDAIRRRHPSVRSRA